MNTNKVVRLKSIGARLRAAAPPPHPNAPPVHLHPQAKRAWIDVVANQPRGLPKADNAMLERAAVLVAHYRRFGMSKSLVTLMNSILTELQLSPMARARVRDRVEASERRP